MWGAEGGLHATQNASKIPSVRSTCALKLTLGGSPGGVVLHCRPAGRCLPQTLIRRMGRSRADSGAQWRIYAGCFGGEGTQRGQIL